MEKVQWNSIKKKQNGLKYSKMTNQPPSPAIVTEWNCNNNKRNILLFYKIWEKYSEIQLTRNKTDFNNRKTKNHSPSPGHVAEKYSKTGRTKPRTHLSTDQSIIKYSPGLQDIEPLKSCSGNRPTMLLKGHPGIKCHSQYIEVIRLLQHSSANL